jgi:enoyl-CoA hydratase/carnithine racemase
MSTPEGRVRLTVDGAVARLLIDRPAARNAMTWQMYDDIAVACARIEIDTSIRLVVLRGAGGRAFIAGTDIEQFRSFTSGEDGIAYEERLETYVDALETLRVPSIAVLEGWVVGGGLAIATACDLRIATHGTRFGVPIARTLGNCLAAPNLRRLAAALGPGWVKRMLLAAEMPTAEELAPTGYLAAVVSAEEMDGAAAELEGRLLHHAPITMRATREMLRRLEQDPAADATDLIRQTYGSADFQAGVEAFLTKTAAEWQDR